MLGQIYVSVPVLVISVTWHFLGLVLLVGFEVKLCKGYVADFLSSCHSISVLWVGGSGVLWGKVSGRSRHRRS